ncbi:MAG: M1 family metallopeptidase [Bacteroidetes bacterium]|nr:M1 family metallopeptidase [Bacteroidota bacterium]
MKPRASIIFTVVILIHTLTYAQSNKRWSSGGKLRPVQANMDIRHYTLSLDIDIPNKAIDGYVETDLVLKQENDSLLFDLVNELKVKKITVDKKNVDFTHHNDLIYIVNAAGFTAGKHRVKIEYSGNPPVAVRPPWIGGFTWTKDKNEKPWVVINCQGEGGKIYFPCKDHPSDEPNEGVDLFVTVPNGLKVAAFGLLQKVTAKGSNTTFHWKTNYTISNYCVVFNIGDYEVVKQTYTTISGRVVPMEFYVLRQDADKANQVLDIRKRDTRILEKYFGEYPWVKEKIGIAQVSNPGMEHQTMITYGDPFNYQRVVGQNYSANLFHEFGHEWWANKVTNKDWAHMWIQEGIDTFAETLCFRELAGERGYDSMMTFFRTRVSNQKPIVQAEELDEASVYSGDIYFKGAVFMGTLRYVLGDEVFFPILKKLATDPKYTYDNFVTTDDVEKLFSMESNKNLKPLFDFYLRTTERLEFMVKQTGENTWKLQVKNLPMTLPIEITTSHGILKLDLTSQSVKIESTGIPVVDPANRYFKRVVIE